MQSHSVLEDLRCLVKYFNESQATSFLFKESNIMDRESNRSSGFVVAPPFHHTGLVVASLLLFCLFSSVIKETKDASFKLLPLAV